MDRATHSCGKSRLDAYHLLDPQGKMLEHSWNADSIRHFFHLNQACKKWRPRELQMSIRCNISTTQITFKTYTLFLIGGACEGARFLMRRSLCISKQ
jgi:hypothetical protein